MSRPAYTFTTVLWQYEGPGGWHFLTLPDEIADAIEDRDSGELKPFGSRRVTVSIGSVTWETSLFVSREAGSYQLPVKAGARREAGLSAGDEVECRIVLAG